MIKNFDYMVRGGNIVARYPFKNIERKGRDEFLLEDEMDLVLQMLMKQNEISKDGYGTIGIDEEDDTIYIMEVVTGNELWKENDYSVYISNRSLKQIRKNEDDNS